MSGGVLKRGIVMFDENSLPYKNRFESKIRDMLRDSIHGHDFEHMNRVWRIAKAIDAGEKEPVDMEVVYAACMLHDIGYLCPELYGTTYELHPQEGVKIAKNILPELGFSDEQIELTLKTILLHDDTKPWGEKLNIDEREIWYVQDADCIEAIGATGILRIISYGTTVGMHSYIPELDFDSPGANRESIVHNIYSHCKNIHTGLHTKTAKKIAKPRVSLMKRFVSQYVAENESFV